MAMYGLSFRLVTDCCSSPSGALHRHTHISHASTHTCPMAYMYGPIPSGQVTDCCSVSPSGRLQRHTCTEHLPATCGEPSEVQTRVWMHLSLDGALTRLMMCWLMRQAASSRISCARMSLPRCNRAMCEPCPPIPPTNVNRVLALGGCSYHSSCVEIHP